MKGLFKRPRTYISLLLLVVVLVAGGFFYNYYQIYKSVADPSNDKASDVVVENPFDKIEGTDEGKIDKDENGQIDGSQNGAQGSQGDANNGANDGSNNAPSTNSNKPSYEQIVGTYKGKFASLQAKQEGKINGVIAQGKAEYVAAKNNGTSVMKIGTKYLNLINKMEGQADSEFNALKGQFESELKKYSYDTKIVGEIDSYYRYKKQATKAQMFSKAKGSL
ncbi:hypothetical protein SAMN00017405_0549 [Desulfonispora thiosulfatigenes DSM 11270]|uniref:Uncharacterized protein n=1 Tax=Desulfonispora thiosulfatigenes DSM 11270 TaxID=656914 RepID=A0A1W1V688_DESTI|nr:hypothetical protein [Desulfonispora thiosulfatigenes]SMB88939.1 hypothetical protein SAMN00017405_0549 [Desulfonispora thiosulfatigenes DSM 11270]